MTQEYLKFLAHHGIEGQKWGVKHGPPYPLDQETSQRVQIKAKARNNVNVTMTEQEPSKFAKFLAKHFSSVRENMERNKNLDITVEGKKIGDAEIFRESKNSLNIVWVGVDESERGKGYATAVMKGIIRHAKNQGCKQVTLEVPGNSPDARHIYEKLGFKAVKVLSEDDPVWGGLTAMKLKL